MSGTGGRRSPLPVGKDYTKEHLGTAVNDLTRILQLIHSKPIRTIGSGNPVCFDGVKAQDIADLMNLTDELYTMLTKAKPVHRVKANAERMLDAMTGFCLGMRGRDAFTDPDDGVVYPSIPSKNNDLLALGIAENNAWVANFDTNFKSLYQDKLQVVYDTNKQVFIDHGLSTAELLAGGFTQDELNTTTWADLIQIALQNDRTEIAWKLIVLAMRVLVSNALIDALEVDTGIRTVSRAAPPSPPPSGGGRLDVDDDDQPADPTPPPAVATRRGEKQALKDTVDTASSNLIHDASLLGQALNERAQHQKDKRSGTRITQKPANWRNPAQNVLNISYSSHAAAPDLQISIEHGKVVGKVLSGPSATTRENLYVITPYSSATKKLTITCHPDAVIDPRLDARLTGSVGGDMLLSEIYKGAQQARYDITDAVRTVCSDPKFAGKPAIIIRAQLVDDSLPNKPIRAPKAGDKDDAIRLISLALLAFNADPRVIVKFPRREYDFLNTMRHIAEVKTFLDFYDPIATKVNTTPVQAFTAAEVAAFREQYLDLYASHLKAFKNR